MRQALAVAAIGVTLGVGTYLAFSWAVNRAYSNGWHSGYDLSRTRCIDAAGPVLDRCDKMYDALQECALSMTCPQDHDVLCPPPTTLACPDCPVVEFDPPCDSSPGYSWQCIKTIEENMRVRVPDETFYLDDRGSNKPPYDSWLTAAHSLECWYNSAENEFECRNKEEK